MAGGVGATGFCAVFGVLRKGSGGVGEGKYCCLLCLHLMVCAQVGLHPQGGVAKISLARGGGAASGRRCSPGETRIWVDVGKGIIRASELLTVMGC